MWGGDVQLSFNLKHRVARSMATTPDLKYTVLSLVNKCPCSE